MEQVLELKHIHYAYHTLEGETPALSDISFALNKGEFVSIVGPSGCGNAMVQQRKHICACFPSHTTLSNIRCKYSLFSITVNELNKFLKD